MHRLFSLLLIFLTIFQANAQQPETQVTVINIEAIPGLQYDKVRFSVSPGEKIKLVFTNKDDMGHNLLIIAPESRLEIVNAALRPRYCGLFQSFTREKTNQ